MTCITEKLKDVRCVFCKKADQVYIGHGDVRFCAHCTISWDPAEDGNFSKSIIFSDSATDGELPEDIVSRMGLLSGQVLSSLDFEGRLRDVLALPEDIFLNGDMKHNRPGDHPGTKKKNNNEGTFEVPKVLQDSIPESGVTGGYRPPEERVWQGERYVEPDKRLSFLQTGEMGEQVAMHAFAEKYGTPFVPLNVGGVTNEPIDVMGDSIGLEVKGAMGYNGDGARGWRAREGQRGKTEKAYLKTLSKKEHKEYTDKKRAAIITRKDNKLAELSANHNRFFKGKMGGVILSADGRHADVFEIDGFHRYVGWPTGAVEANYIGTYSIGNDVFEAAVNKYLKAVADSGYTLETLIYQGSMMDYDSCLISPEMHDLLGWPHIWLYVCNNEGIEVALYLEALLAAEIDPETVSNSELNTIWNHTFPQEPIEVDLTYLMIQKNAAVEFLKHNRQGNHPKKFSTREEIVDEFTGENSWNKWRLGLSWQEKQGIYNYTSKGYEQINYQLRSGKADGSGNTLPVDFFVMEIDKALDKSSLHRDVQAYRGFKHEGMFNSAKKGIIKPGDQLTDNGYVSTALLEKRATSEKYNVLWRVSAPEGTKGAFIGARNMSAKETENELLLARKTTFRVDKVVLGKNPVTGEDRAEYDVTVLSSLGDAKAVKTYADYTQEEIDEILRAGMPDDGTPRHPDGPSFGETVEFGITIKRDGEEVDISDLKE